MSKRKVYPKSKQQDLGLIVKKQTDFSGGEVKDIDPREIKGNEVTSMKNMRGYTDCSRGRIGCVLDQNVDLPTYADGGATTWTATQSTTTVTKVAGTDDFTSALIGKYWVFEAVGGEAGTPAVHAYISAVPSTTTLTVANSATVGTTRAGHVRAKINASFSDHVQKRIYMLVGEKIYTTPSSTLSWKEIYKSGMHAPYDAFSRFYMIENKIILVNCNGIFGIDATNEDGNKMYYWKKNDLPPKIEDTIIEVPETSIDSAGYRYIYTLSRFKNAMLNGDRTMAEDGVVLESETCPAVRTSDIEDYSITYTRFPIGNCKVIRGKNLGGPSTFVLMPTVIGWGGSAKSFKVDEYDAWRLYSDNGAFSITVRDDNGVTIAHDITPNLKRITSMKGFVRAVQKALNTHLPSVRFKFATNDKNLGEAYFYMYSKRDEDDIVSFGDSSDTNKYTMYAQLGLDSTTTIYNSGNVIGELKIPRDEMGAIATYTPTHYTIYRTRDVSVALADIPDMLDPRISVNPHLFTWVADIPVCKPFRASITKNGVLLQQAKILTAEDVGSIIRISGIAMVITDMESDYQFRVVLDDGSGTNRPPAMSETNGILGGKLAFTASKSGDTVTSSLTFLSAQVGQFLFWLDGSTSVIKAVTSGVATTVDTDDKTLQACGMTPTSRKFCDTVSDIELDGRIESWPLRTRFYKRMPDPNIGAIVEGFLFVGHQNFNEYYYCSTNNPFDIGYYHGAGQYGNSILEGITNMCKIKQNMIFRCKHKTYRLNPQVAIPAGSPKFGESYLSLGEPITVSNSIGTLDDTSYTERDDGTQIVFTSEPAVRYFDGNEYGMNLAANRIQKSDIEKLDKRKIIDYDPVVGLHIWGTQA